MRTAEQVLLHAESCPCDGGGGNDGACRRRFEQAVVRSAAQFASEGRLEDSFKLLSSVRLDHANSGATEGGGSHALFCLRNKLLRYEQNRIRRLRRRLVYVLAGVLAYLFLVSPSVFVALENPYRVSHGLSALDWSEGLYWSVITSTTVGYGDLVPFTPFGRMFALFDALLGVLLMGVTSGLILSTLTPRRLD